MSSLKGTAYPNLVDAMKKVGEAHSGITGSVSNHAKNSTERREAERTRLGMVHAAKAVLEQDGAP